MQPVAGATCVRSAAVVYKRSTTACRCPRLAVRVLVKRRRRLTLTACAGQCVLMCPASYSMWGTMQAVGRVCRPSSFVCRRSQGCTCDLGGCHECTSTTCTMCDASRFMVNGRCRKQLTCIGKRVRWLPGLSKGTAIGGAALKSTAAASPSHSHLPLLHDLACSLPYVLSAVHALCRACSVPCVLALARGGDSTMSFRVGPPVTVEPRRRSRAKPARFQADGASCKPSNAHTHPLSPVCYTMKPSNPVLRF